MSNESEPTFRGFAAAVGDKDLDRASDVLEHLLGVDAAVARGCSEHFQRQLDTGPEFMMKAMGMRQVVAEGTEEQLTALLGDCFDLHGDAAGDATKIVLKRFR